MTPIEKIKELLDVLRIEKKEEAENFQQLLKQTPLNERVKKGVAWYPVSVESSGYGIGEYPFLVIERGKNLSKPHKLRAGHPVLFFSQTARELNANNGVPPEIPAVIHFVDGDKMKIIFHRDELPDWVGSGKCGVEMAFDERSYREMEKALDIVMKAKQNRLADLRDILYGEKNPSYFPEEKISHLTVLNESQVEAVQHILAANDVAIVHGPPGTGKTTTLVQAIRLLAQQQKPVLVCAPSNPATDLLASKLATEGLNVIRMGNISRIDEDILNLTIEYTLANRPEMHEVKRMKIEAAQLRRKADQFKRSFGPKEREERRIARDEARAVAQHARMLEAYVIKKVLDEADVICCTLIGATDSYLDGRRFHTVVIDEAAQALEPATWVPILKADKVVLAGDPFQLPPTVKSQEAMRKGLNDTLMEKSLMILPEVRLLKVQYRMHETIMNFSNERFYGGELRAADFVKYRTVELAEGARMDALEFIDTAGCGFEEQQNPETLSSFNPEEYAILWKHLDNLLHYADIAGSRPSIGIITPYREQAIYMQQRLKTDFDQFPWADITVDTVDAFQGQERDIIYISLVRSNDRSEIGFLSDVRRMNVAMTRARRKLVVIGDSATIGSHHFYEAFLIYCEKNGAYQSAWEWA